MGIISINVNTTGLVGENVRPRRCTLVTTDSLATITTAGYLNNQNLLGNSINATDVFDILYAFNAATQVGIFGIFQVTYSSSTGFTLNVWENPGNVLLPVVSGNVATFNGTSGQISDSGIASSALQLKANIKAARTANIGGAGAGPISVTVSGLTSSSIVTGSIQASTNPVVIQKMTATATGFDVLFSADPGATCTVNYIAFVAAQ